MSTVSNSFTRAEVEYMHQLLQAVARGGDTSVLVRHPSFATFRGKVQRMLKRAEAKLEKRQRLDSGGENETGNGSEG